MSRVSLALLVGFGLLAGCSGESTTSDPDVVIDGSGAALCDAIPRATDVGTPCGAGSACGEGALCVSSGSDGANQCTQVCFPESCGDTCNPGRVCATVNGSDGSPFSMDVNGDGTDEVLGACVTPQPGDRQAYETCGSSGSCASGLLCAGVNGRSEGTCFPTCADSCDPYEGFAATCAPTSSDREICVVTCDPALGTDACPSGMTCETLAQGTAVCVR